MKNSMRWLSAFALTAAMASEASDNKALDLALKTIRQNRLLTAKQIECVLFTVDETEGTVATVSVREKHNKKCGGDPNTSPRMFSLDIDLKTGAAQWDNNSAMEMRPIPQAHGASR